MPDPRRAIRTRSIFDKSGILWFTRAAGEHDRPARSEDRRDQARDLADAEVAALRHGGRTRKGVPFVVEFGSNKIASVDPKTLEIKEYTLPDAGGAAAADGHRARRHGLVHGLRARLSRPARPGDRQGARNGRRRAGRSPQPYGIVVHQGRDLVQRIGRASRTPSCASIRRPRNSRPGRSPAAATSCATWTSTPRRQPGAGEQPRQPGRPGEHRRTVTSESRGGSRTRSASPRTNLLADLHHHRRVIAGADVGEHGAARHASRDRAGGKDVVDAPADVPLAHVAPGRPPGEQALVVGVQRPADVDEMLAQSCANSSRSSGRWPITSGLRSRGCTSISARAMLRSPQSTSSRPSVVQRRAHARAASRSRSSPRNPCRRSAHTPTR